MIRIPDPETLSRIDFKSPATWIATWGGCGFLQPGPGTWGTIGALPFGIILMLFGGKIALTAGLLIILPLGILGCRPFRRDDGAARQQHDRHRRSGRDVGGPDDGGPFPPVRRSGFCPVPAF